MSALSIEVPFPVFQDRDGQPLENGYVWLGVANLNPQTNPVIAYFDKALTIPAAQPLRTINGYISNAGTPAQVYVDGVSFSILVQDSKGSMVYNFPDGTGISPDACNVIYNPPFSGAVATPVCVKLAETVSVKDFGAVGDGVTDDTVAIQAAINAIGVNGVLTFPPTNDFYLIGEGVSIEPLDGQTFLMYGATIKKSSTLAARSDNLFEIYGKSGVSFYGGLLEKLVGNHLAFFVAENSANIKIKDVDVDRLQIFIERNCSDIVIDGGTHSGVGTQAAIATGGLLPPMNVGANGREPGLVSGVTITNKTFTGFAQEVIDINCHTQGIYCNNLNMIDVGELDTDEIIDFGFCGADDGIVTTGGSGYSINDLLTVNGGEFSPGLSAIYKVTGLSGSSVTTITLVDTGFYFKAPGIKSFNAPLGYFQTTGNTTTSSSGSGCELTIDWTYCGHAFFNNIYIKIKNGVSKRGFRVKWESRDVHITNSSVISPSLPLTSTGAELISIEQANDIFIDNFYGQNQDQGIAIEGPLENVYISNSTIKNVRRNAIATGNRASTSTTYNVKVDNVVIDSPNIITNDEAIDFGFADGFSIDNTKIILGSDTSVNGVEIRSTCLNGYLSNMEVSGGATNKILISSSASGIKLVDWNESFANRTETNSFSLVATIDKKIQYLSGTIGGARTLTLSTVSAYEGAYFKIIFANTPNANNWDVGPGLVTLSSQDTCEVAWDGSAWVLINKGTL